MPKNSKSALKEAIEELSRGFHIECLDNCLDLYTGIDCDTLTYEFACGTGSIALQHSHKSGAISIAIRRTKDDDEPTTVRYITVNTYKDSKEKLNQVVEIIFNSAYSGNDIDYVIEHTNALIPKKSSFAERFVEILTSKGIFDTPENQ